MLDQKIVHGGFVIPELIPISSPKFITDPYNINISRLILNIINNLSGCSSPRKRGHLCKAIDGGNYQAKCYMRLGV